jgi:hypothetical protein
VAENRWHVRTVRSLLFPILAENQPKRCNRIPASRARWKMDVTREITGEGLFSSAWFDEGV